MERLKKIQKDHHYIVDWHIPKKEKEKAKKPDEKEKEIFVDYGHYTKKN